MTDPSTTDSTSAQRWRERGIRGLTLARGAYRSSEAWLRKRWERLVGLFEKLERAAAAEPYSPAANLPAERRDAVGPITVPARDHVFTFDIRATFTWSADVRPELLSWYSRYFLPRAVQRLKRVAAQHARTLAPDRAGELQVRLQRVLASEGPWTYQRGDVTVTCQPEAWVRLDERVRRTLQPYWERSLTLKWQYDEYLRRAQYVERLNRRWVTILKEFTDSPAAEQATQATMEHLAEAVQHMMAEQEAAAQWSSDLLRDSRRNRDAAEPFSSLDIPPVGPPGQAHEPSPAPGDPAAETAAVPQGNPDELASDDHRRSG